MLKTVVLKSWISFKLVAILLFCLAFKLNALDAQNKQLQPNNLFPKVKIETSVGNIIVELDRNKAPITVNNFLSYVVEASYDETIFHRVVKDFVIQGGGYDAAFNERKQKPAIFNESGNGLKNQLYTIAMARYDDPHSATNQFYFNMADNESLDPGRNWGYTVFGWVMEGSDVLDLIGNSQTYFNKQLDWEDVPVKPVTIKKIVLLEQQ